MRIVGRILSSIFLLIIMAICTFGIVMSWQEELPSAERILWLVGLGGVGVLCLLALFYYKRLVCPGCGCIPIPRQRCGLCRSPLPTAPRVFAIGLFLLLTGMLYLLVAPDVGSHPPSPKSAFTSGYASGFRYGASVERNGEDEELETLARQRAGEAVRGFHGTLYAAFRTSFPNGRVAGLASKEPHQLPLWVNANDPVHQAEWFRLTEEMNYVGGELQRVEGLVARIEALQSKLEILARERPADDRALLDACCDKLSALHAALRDFRDQLAQDKGSAPTR